MMLLSLFPSVWSLVGHLSFERRHWSALWTGMAAVVATFRSVGGVNNATSVWHEVSTQGRFLGGISWLGVLFLSLGMWRLAPPSDAK